MIQALWDPQLDAALDQQAKQCSEKVSLCDPSPVGVRHVHVRIGRGSGLRRPNDDGRGRPSIRIDHHDSGMHGVSTHIRVWLRFCMRMAPPTPRPVEVNAAGQKCVAEAVPMHRKDRGGYQYRLPNR